MDLDLECKQIILKKFKHPDVNCLWNKKKQQKKQDLKKTKKNVDVNYLKDP